MEIQKKLRDYASSAPKNEIFKLGIGIHAGDVIHKENDVFGDPFPHARSRQLLGANLQI